MGIDGLIAGIATAIEYQAGCSEQGQEKSRPALIALLRNGPGGQRSAGFKILPSLISIEGPADSRPGAYG